MSIVFAPYASGSFRGHLSTQGRFYEINAAVHGHVSLRTAMHGSQDNSGQMRGHSRAMRTRWLAEAVEGWIAGQVPLDAYWSAGDVNISGAWVYGSLFDRASFTGNRRNQGEIHGTLASHALLSDEAAIFRSRVALRSVWRGALPASDRGAMVVQWLSMAAHGYRGMPVTLRDHLDMLDDATPHWVMVRRAMLGLHADRTTLLDGLETQRETLALDDVKGIVWNMLVEEGLALSEQTEAWAETLLQMVDALTLTAGAGALLDGRHTVAQALVWMDASAYAWPAAIREVLDLAEMTTHGLHGAEKLLEVLRLHAVAEGHADMVALVDENLTLDETVSGSADLLARIREGTEVLATFHLPDDTTYTAWVLHGAARAYTEYRNFPFNSFCELDGRYFGASDTGLYELTGEDDDGTPIDAHIRSGLDDLGTGKLKRVPAMYLGYRADGDLVMKVVTTSETGDKREDWYAVQPRPADAMREGRVKLGRGLKSRYWGFELSNVDGADFEIDTIAWLPMVLERRV